MLGLEVLRSIFGVITGQSDDRPGRRVWTDYDGTFYLLNVWHGSGRKFDTFRLGDEKSVKYLAMCLQYAPKHKGFDGKFAITSKHKEHIKIPSWGVEDAYGMIHALAYTIGSVGERDYQKQIAQRAKVIATEIRNLR